MHFALMWYNYSRLLGGVNMNCDKCNAIMILDSELPKCYHCPKCQTKAHIVKGYIEWFDIDGNSFTPKPLDDSDIEDIEKEINNWLKK